MHWKEEKNAQYSSLRIDDFNTLELVGKRELKSTCARKEYKKHENDEETRPSGKWAWKVSSRVVRWWVI